MYIQITSLSSPLVVVVVVVPVSNTLIVRSDEHVATLFIYVLSLLLFSLMMMMIGFSDVVLREYKKCQYSYS